MKILVQRLRERTTALGITHKDVAIRAGIDPRNYGHYVVGRSRPPYEKLLKIAKALRTTPNYLLGFEVETNDAIEQLIAACQGLSIDKLRFLTTTAEALEKDPR